MGGVFLNYRRDDTSGHAGRLYDRLAIRFGAERVFMDVNIEPGVDFEQAIRRHVGQCDAFIVLIGRYWLTIPDRTGRPRLEDPRDWTRLEIQIALERDIPVIPVLVHGARMPTPDELPEPLRKLSTRAALELSDQRWDYDAGRLLQVIAKWLHPLDDAADTENGTGEHTMRNGRGSPNGDNRSPSGATGQSKRLRGIDWPEFTMSAALAFTWFWAGPRWLAHAEDGASEGIWRALALSWPALLCGYGSGFASLLPVFKAIANTPKTILVWMPIGFAVLCSGLVAAAEILQPYSDGQFGAVTSGALALACCSLGPILAAHLRSLNWSASQLTVRTLVASGAFTLGTRISHFRPHAPFLGDLLYNGVALVPLVCAAFAGRSAWRKGQHGDFGRSWVVVPLVAGALLLGHGGIRGKVVDESGSVLPGTTVEYGQCTSSSGESGDFAVDNLCLPIYLQAFAPTELRFSLSGFTSARISTVTLPGVNRYVNVPLKVGAVAESAEISSPAFTLMTVLVLPLTLLSIALPLMWLRRRKQHPPVLFRVS